jgi:chromosome segregation protein
LGERRTQLGREAEENQGVITVHRQSQETLREQLAEKEGLLQSLVADLGDLETQKKERLTAIQNLSAEAGELEVEIAACQRRQDTLRARQDLLSRMQQDLAGFYEGVRAVLKAAHDEATLPGMIGTVAHLLRVPTNLETAIETALGGHLQDVVVETWADAETAIAHLKATQGGRATFLPLDTIHPSEPIRPPKTKGVLGIASDLVTCDERLAQVTRLLLGRTLVVEDLAAARRAFSDMRGGFQIVTRPGELVRSGGSVSGGSVSRDKAGGGFLAREREWRELPATIAEQESQRQALQASLEQNQHVQTEHQSRLEELAQRQAKLQATQSSLNQERESLDRENERAEEAIQWQHSLLERLDAELANLDQSEERLRAEIEDFRAAQTQAQERARELANQASTLTAEALLTELSQAQTELAVIEGRQDSHRATLESHEANLAELNARIKRARNAAGPFDHPA